MPSSIQRELVGFYLLMPMPFTASKTDASTMAALRDVMTEDVLLAHTASGTAAILARSGERLPVRVRKTSDSVMFIMAPQ
jgi:hypothetical protein